MKLFFKHLFQSIRRKPAQPAVLIATLAIAVGVSIMSFGLSTAFSEERISAELEQYGSTDISVSLNGTSKSRFMFTDEVRALLGDRASVAGIYELPLLSGEGKKLSFAAATDLFEIENIFNFSFTEYREVKKAEISEVAFISSDFAKEHGLGVGDVFDSELLGGEKSYTVAAISPTGYLASYDVMLDIGGVMAVLGEDSLFVSALGDSFRPASTIYIDVKNNADIEECKELLSKNQSFADKTLLAIEDNAESESDIETMQILVNVARSFAAILSVAVTFCCLYILAAERSEENQSFRVAGARVLHLNLLQYAEVLIYWLVGSALGVGIGALLLKFTVYYAKFKYSNGQLALSDVSYGVLMVLVASLLTVTSFIISTAKAKRSKKERGIIFLVAISLLTTAVAYSVSFSVPIRDSFLPSLLAMVAVFILSFIAASGLLRFLMRGIDFALEKRFETMLNLKFPALRYAVKNVFSVRVLHNFTRLISLLVSVLLSCFLVIVSTEGYVLAANEMIQADYVVLNSAESCYQKLVNLDTVSKASKSFFGSARFEDGRYTPAISIDDTDMLSHLIGISEIPTGNEAVFCVGQARANGLRVGDLAEINIDGLLCEVKVSEITDCGLNVVVFDAEHFGIADNMILITGDEGISKERLMLDISERAALEVAAVMTPDELMEKRLSSVSVYLDTGDVLLTVAVVFAFIGMLDNLVQSYRERRGEFELYKSAGMSGESIRRMKVLEVFLSLAFGILFGALTFVAASFVISRGLLAYGYDVFRAVAMLK